MRSFWSLRFLPRRGGFSPRSGPRAKSTQNRGLGRTLPACFNSFAGPGLELYHRKARSAIEFVPLERTMKALGMLLILLGCGVAGYGAWQSMTWGWDANTLEELGVGVVTAVSGLFLRGMTW